MTTTPSTDPLAWLDSNHAHYDAMNTNLRWKRWRAVLDEFDTVEAKKAFLPSTEVELHADYEQRIKISEFLGVTGSSINRLIGAVFGVPARIDPKNDKVVEFMKNVDGLKTSLVSFFEDVSRESQGMGIAYVGIDRTKAAKGSVTRAAADANLRIFLTLYTAEELCNWGDDENDGALLWVNIRRLISVQASATTEPRFFRESRVIDRSEVTVYRKEVGKDGNDLKQEARWSIHVTPVAHGVGRVPIEPVYGVRVDHMKGKSLHAGAINADIAKFNEESWGAMDRYRHANQLLVIQSDKQISEMVTGPAFRIARNEDVKYVSPSGAAFEAREKAIERLRREGVAQSGTNANGTADSGNSTTGESGIAMRVRFTHTEKRAIDQHSGWIEEAIRRVLGVVHMFVTGKEATEEIVVSFFSTFEVFELPDIMSNYQKAQYWIRSATWHREQLKLIASKSLPDCGDDVKETIKKEIEAQPMAAAPDPGDTDPLGT